MSESTQQQQAEQLTDELAKKYDPERLLRLMQRRAGKGEPLDHVLRAKYEKRFGVDLGHVRIYTGEFAEEFNRQRGAYAVTVGSTGMILMGGSPEKSMARAAGQGLLAHELTHVAQARRGLHRASPMPLASETNEADAHATEAAVSQGGGDPGAGVKAVDAKAAQKAAEEAKKDAIEKIKQRVYEMAADAARHQQQRNGVQRRP